MASQPFKLSATLLGHTQDVRSLAVDEQSGTLFSASRDSTVRAWTRKSGQWEPSTVYADHHQGFVNSVAVCVVDGRSYLLSGGQDSLILAWPISDELEASPKVAFTMIGHQHNVCSLDSDASGRIVSGSWDKTARIWRNFELVHTLPEHGQAVWAVVALEPCRATNQQPAVLTGAADNLIRLFIGDTADKATRVFKGHDQPVRALVRHPDHETQTFLSAGNDGSVRLWSLDGDQLAQLAGHDSFVYSLAALPLGQGLVSGGEDRSVRVWRDADGECEQTITLPAISVWTVATLSSGDVVAGTNDGTIRIFSREPDRFADAAAMADYEAALAKSTINTQQIGDVKKSDLPGPEALQQPGRKEGQVKMIKNGDKVEAHMWNAAEGQWTQVGEVVDGVGNAQKQLYQGQEYDYVFDVDIQEGVPPLKLPYNANQNPYEAAQKFLLANELPTEYESQIVDFIDRNTRGTNMTVDTNTYVDPFTGAGRYVPAPATGPPAPWTGDPFTGGAPPAAKVAKTSILPHRVALGFTQAKLPALRAKLGELNAQQAGDNVLNAGELAAVDALIAKPPSAGATLPPTAVSAVTKSLEWPAASRLPSLDLARVLAASVVLPADALLLVLASLQSDDGAPAKANETNAMLALRAIANSMLHSAGATVLANMCDDVLSFMPASSSLSGPGRVARATVALNYSTLAVSKALPSSSAKALIGLAIAVLEDATADSEATYRGLVASGNILLAPGFESSVDSSELLRLRTTAREAGKRFASEQRIADVVKEMELL